MAAYTRQLAIFTMLLVGATVVLGAVGIWQGRHIKRSVTIAERTLTELERPYVFWKEMKTDLPAYMSPKLSWNPRTTGPQFILSIINHGRTPANIDSASVRLEMRNSVPPGPPKGFNVIAANAAPIAPGDTQGYSVEMIVGPNAPFEFPSLRCEHEFGILSEPKISEGQPLHAVLLRLARISRHFFRAARDCFLPPVGPALE